MNVRLVARFATMALRRSPCMRVVSTPAYIGAGALITCAAVQLVSGAVAHAYPARVQDVYYLKVRAAPSFEAREVGVLEAGERVEVVGESGPWMAVELDDGKTGYVSGKYLAAVGPERPLAPASARAQPPPSTVLPLPETAPAAAAGSVPASERAHNQKACTRTDLDALKRRIDDLVAAQERLTESVGEVLRLRAAASQQRTSGPSLAARQVAFWLAVGCVVGWAAAGSYRRRRQRNRIRI